jgi:signal transduction histidine kinase/DNA-binding response OmpR family regulator
MAAVAAALLVAGAASVVNEVLSFRAATLAGLSVRAEMVSRLSTSALVFRDPESAAATLAALRGDPHVVAASIRDQNGDTFASYQRDAGAHLRQVTAGEGEQFHFEGGHLLLSRPIEFDGRRIGSLAIEADLRELGSRLGRFGLIVALVLLGSSVLAYSTVARLQRRITGPVLSLVETAQAVSTRQDHSVRATAVAEGELGLLLRTFNAMLDQIEERGAALERARADLEQQVEERTAALRHEVAERRTLADQLEAQNRTLQEQSLRVQEATRLKSEFLANMSHELRTPLNAIIGFAELMHDAKLGPVSPTHRECLDDILTSSRHLLQLINDVLDLAKIEAGKMEFRPEEVSLAKVVGEVRDVLRTLTARRRIRLTVDVGPGLDRVYLDPGKLKQVLYNFLSNALKFAPEGGRVTVRASPEGDTHFRLDVEDNGPGIKAEDLPRLFAEFQQLDTGTAKPHQGTGLGLALTRRIVEGQGGTVGVRSVTGQGSVFHAVLPVRAPGNQPLARPQAPLPALPGAPVLLVIEDDAADRAWLLQMLTSLGYSVEGADSGEAALRRCAERRFDGITLDLFLGDMNGWDVLTKLRKEGPNRETPVVVVTVVAEKGVGAGFTIHDYLVKPVQADLLLASLQRAGLEPPTSGPVLVIDDDPQIRRLIETTLRGFGYDPLLASGGAEGIEAVRQAAPAAVVLDLLMPGMDGFEFLDRFRELPTTRRTPVIVWTAKDLSGSDRARLAAAAQAVVLKREGSASLLLEELAQHVPLPRAPSGERG